MDNLDIIKVDKRVKQREEEEEKKIKDNEEKKIA